MDNIYHVWLVIILAGLLAVVAGMLFGLVSENKCWWYVIVMVIRPKLIEIADVREVNLFYAYYKNYGIYVDQAYPYDLFLR